MPVIPFATQSYKHPSLSISAQRAVNCYAEKEPPDAKSQVAVLGSPGLFNFATCGNGPVRGMRALNGLLYVVSGGTLYSVSATGTVAPIGGIIGGSGVVQMSDNGTQLSIVNGANGYIYSPALGFIVVSDPNFHPANTVTFFDNVFVFDWAGTNKFFISNTLDGTSYPGLGFASAEVTSANVLTTINQQENLLIFTADHTEIWFDAGTANMPFLRVDGGVIERGCAAGKTALKEDNSVFFLGDDLIFYRLNNMSPQRVSTHAIEAAWRGYSTVSDAFAFSISHNGHKFIALTFPTANATWEFDIATGLWHERVSWDQNGNSYGRWRGNCHAVFNGLNLIGDAFSGQIGVLDEGTFTEFGNAMQAYMVSPVVHSDRKRLFCSRFELDVLSGVGIDSGQGSNPQVMLRWSKDGGRTFLPFQIFQSMGKEGAYGQRLRWLKLGQARSWIFEATISDPVRRTVIAANADFSQGM